MIEHFSCASPLLAVASLTGQIDESCAHISMESNALRAAMEPCVPYLVMILCQLSPAVFLAVLKVALDPSHGLSATVLVLYEQIISSLLLSSLALLFERKERPKITFRLLCYTFLIALLQIPLGQLLLTASLRYITVTFESVAMNAIPVVVFLLAVASGREHFRVWGIHGQAKLWGILVSAAGATVMVLYSHSDEQVGAAGTSDGRLIGWLMVGLAVLTGASSYILVERVAIEFPAHLTLAAMISISGTVQVAAFSVLTEKDPSSWRVDWSGSLQLFCIIYGGLIAGGIGSCATNWCNHKKGPSFTSAFYPVLIIFSFLIETFILRRPAHPESVIGVMLVIGGLYLFFWEKSKDCKANTYVDGSQIHPIEGFNEEPLLQSKV